MRETMITVTGNVGGAPTFFEAEANGDPRLRLSVATTPRFRDRGSGEWRDGRTSWYDVWMHGRMALNAKDSISKGDAVVVTGSVEFVRWEDGEKSGRKAVINARAFGPDLNKFPVTISRVRLVEAAGDGAAQDAGPGTEHDGNGSDRIPDVTGYAEVDEDGNPLPVPDADADADADANGDPQHPAETSSIAGRMVAGL
ncbi:single-stranded DNA-binding protein [Pseudactinotalea sp. Z1748]|uniref:single-stranded DNA-binding protein n=1 Tax=Pseudactinotalea sp. Z1748 TaxID=3413027 RepID=UPI003C7E0EC9